MSVEKAKIHFIVVAGLSADDKEARAFKDVLEKDGYGAEAVSFYGEKYIDDFTGMKISDCIANVSDVINRAAEKYEYVYGIGISLGGSLLLEHAKTCGNLDGIASVGTPVKLKKRFLVTLVQKIYPLIYPVWRRLQRIKRLRLMPIGAGNMVIEYIEKYFMKDLGAVKTPVLFLHTKTDKVSDYRAIPQLLEIVSSSQKQLRFFENGNHIIDKDIHVIIKSVLEFFRLLPADLPVADISYAADLSLESQKQGLIIKNNQI